MIPPSIRLPEDPESHVLAEQLRLRLAWLPYDAFAFCMVRLLRQLNFAGVERSSRRSLKGPNDLSGIDIRALLDTGLELVPVAVQVKRYKGPHHVPKRFVTELRGALLERDIPYGLILSTFSFSREAHEAARNYPGRPIRLVEGTELGLLMLVCRIGVVERTDLTPGKSSLLFDEEAFTFLEDYCRNQRKGGQR